MTFWFHYFIYIYIYIYCFQAVHILILTTVVQKVDSTDHFTSLKNCPSTPPLSQNKHLLFTQPGKLLPQGRGRWVVCQKRISSEYTFIQWITQYDSVTDLQLNGWGGGHRDHEIRGARSQKIFFRSLGSQFSLLTKDNGGCPPGPSLDPTLFSVTIVCQNQ